VKKNSSRKEGTERVWDKHQKSFGAKTSFDMMTESTRIKRCKIDELG